MSGLPGPVGGGYDLNTLHSCMKIPKNKAIIFN